MLVVLTQTITIDNYLLLEFYRLKKKNRLNENEIRNWSPSWQTLTVKM